MRKDLNWVVALLFLICLLAQGVGAQSPEELRAEREAILGVVGEVIDQQYSLYPLTRGVGRVFTQPVAETGAEALRVRFAVLEVPDGPTWNVVLRNQDKAIVWFASEGELGASSFWSDEVAGSSLTVEVYSVEPASRLKIKIDKIAARKPGTSPLSLTGSNDLQAIRGQQRWIENAGESVARVRFVGDDGKMYFCTAFLVAPELMLTNQHCISSDSEMRSALIDFDYNEANAPFRSARLKKLCVSNYMLDYALVRLQNPVQRSILRLAPDQPLAEEQALVIVQHPSGEPKQVTMKDCKIEGVRVKGRGVNGGQTDLGHTCDTKGGSSGSPVFDAASHEVVGLHHLGFRPNSSLLANRAVRIGLVLDHIENFERDLLQEISGVP